jgi:hypothetical protein
MSRRRVFPPAVRGGTIFLPILSSQPAQLEKVLTLEDKGCPHKVKRGLKDLSLCAQ